MADRIHVGTRKGLFELARDGGRWEVADVRFLGDPVTAVLEHEGSVFAALDLGHFGAKLWRRNANGAWRELATPAFPPEPDDAGDDPHPLPSTPAASGSPSARPPAACGYPRTAATPGVRPRCGCRRSMSCISRKGETRLPSLPVGS